tara:strand:- start:4255 stop:4533 length:279 start_codon:yes stop_codon:yes gene_type:complete
MDNTDVAIELTHNCVRNYTILEDIHAGKTLPDKYMKGYSRITQKEMKILMEGVITNIKNHLDNPEMLCVSFDSGIFKAPPDWYQNKERYESI